MSGPGYLHDPNHPSTRATHNEPSYPDMAEVVKGLAAAVKGLRGGHTPRWPVT